MIPLEIINKAPVKIPQSTSYCHSPTCSLQTTLYEGRLHTRHRVPFLTDSPPHPLSICHDDLSSPCYRWYMHMLWRDCFQGIQRCRLGYKHDFTVQIKNTWWSVVSKRETSSHEYGPQERFITYSVIEIRFNLINRNQCSDGINLCFFRNLGSPIEDPNYSCLKYNITHTCR